MSDPQFQYSYMPHTQVQYTEQRAYVQPSYMGPSTSHLSPDPGFPEEYSPTNPTFHQPSSYQTPIIHMGTRLQTPNFLFTPLIHNPHIWMRTAIVPKWNLTPNHNDQAMRTRGHVYTKPVQQAM